MVIASVLFVVTGLTGFRVAGEETSRLHLLLSLCALVSILFTYFWVVLYVAGIGNLGSTGSRAATTLDEEALADWSRARRTASWTALSVILLALATSVAGGGTVAGAVAPNFHLVLFAVSLIAQIAAIRIVARTLGRAESLLCTLEREEA